MIDTSTGFYQTLYTPEESFLYRDFEKEEENENQWNQEGSSKLSGGVK